MSQAEYHAHVRFFQLTDTYAHLAHARQPIRQACTASASVRTSARDQAPCTASLHCASVAGDSGPVRREDHLNQRLSDDSEVSHTPTTVRAGAPIASWLSATEAVEASTSARLARFGGSFASLEE